MSDYIYLGDKQTDERFKNKPCNAVRRANGKCIRGKNRNMAVESESGEKGASNGKAPVRIIF